jgi:rRNA maturation RNase YbeY
MAKNIEKAVQLPFLTDSISFHFIDISFVLRNRSHLRDWLTRCVLNENKRVGELSYNFCSDKYLLKLNRDHLGHNYYTDIITFDLCQGDYISGDIYISIDRVKDNAQEYGVSVKDELHRVMVHGVMHLCGYKDKTKKQAEEMRTKEGECLSLR